MLPPFVMGMTIPVRQTSLTKEGSTSCDGGSKILRASLVIPPGPGGTPSFSVLSGMFLLRHEENVIN